MGRFESYLGQEGVPRALLKQRPQCGDGCKVKQVLGPLLDFGNNVHAQVPKAFQNGYAIQVVDGQPSFDEPVNLFFCTPDTPPREPAIPLIAAIKEKQSEAFVGYTDNHKKWQYAPCYPVIQQDDQIKSTGGHPIKTHAGISFVLGTEGEPGEPKVITKISAASGSEETEASEKYGCCFGLRPGNFGRSQYWAWDSDTGKPRGKCQRGDFCCQTPQDSNTGQPEIIDEHQLELCQKANKRHQTYKENSGLRGNCKLQGQHCRFFPL